MSDTLSTGQEHPASGSKRATGSFRGRGRGRGRFFPGKRSAEDVKEIEPKRPMIGSQKDSRKPSTSTLTTKPVLTYDPVPTLNHHLRSLSQAVYNAMVGRDQRMAATTSPLHIEYVTSVAFFAKLARCAVELAYAAHIPQPGNISIGANIPLPEILAKYVDGVGSHAICGDSYIVPYIPTRADWNRRFRTLRDILEEADRPVPNGFWSLDYAWISEWVLSTTRPSAISLGFRKIASGTEGSPVMAVIRGNPDDDDFIKGYTSSPVSEAEAILGAIFGYRERDGDYPPAMGYEYLCPPRFSTRSFRPELELAFIIRDTIS